MRYLVLLMLTASQMAYSFDCNQPQTEYQTIVCQAYEATLIPDHTATHEPILIDSHQITRVDQTTSNQPPLIKPPLIKPLLIKPLLIKPLLIKPLLIKPLLIKPLLIKPLLIKPLLIKPLLIKRDDKA